MDPGKDDAGRQPGADSAGHERLDDAHAGDGSLSAPVFVDRRDDFEREAATARARNRRADDRDMRLDLLSSLRLELPDLSRAVLLAVVRTLPMSAKTRRELRMLLGGPRG